MESSFQFTNPSLTQLEFLVNELFDKENNKQAKIKMHLSIEVEKKDNILGEAQVALTLEMGDKSADVPFYIRAVEKANFRWDQSLKENDVDSMLKQNAPALLLSYLRPIIVQVTASSLYGAYHIPFMNFVGT